MKGRHLKQCGSTFESGYNPSVYTSGAGHDVLYIAGTVAPL